jgi:hypothetical protein
VFQRWHPLSGEPIALLAEHMELVGPIKHRCRVKKSGNFSCACMNVCLNWHTDDFFDNYFVRNVLKCACNGVDYDLRVAGLMVFKTSCVRDATEAFHAAFNRFPLIT